MIQSISTLFLFEEGKSMDIRIKKRGLALITAVIFLVACNSPSVKENRTSSVSSGNQTASISSNSAEVKKLLAEHNIARANEGLSALIWSEDLANYAQEWANQLKATKNCDIVHRPTSGQFKQRYGENLFQAGALTWSDGRTELQKISAKDVVGPWVAEKSDYNLASNTCDAGKVCGHYTQVVWKKTTQVGCAVAVCGNKSQAWVCNYNPPGNYIGQRPF